MKKPPYPDVGRAVILYAARSLQCANLLGLGALGALAELELNLLVLLQVTEAVALDLGVVDEYVCGSVGGGDEAEALLSVEPPYELPLFLMR